MPGVLTNSGILAPFMKIRGVTNLIIHLKITVMKTSTLLVTTVIASLFLLGACKNNNTQVPVAATDTTGFAQFQQWKNSLATEQTNQVIAHKHSTARKSTSGTMNSSTTNEAKVVKKKGWSKAAKYAVIGTAAGAVTGAIINKRNPVKGAVIGGVILGGGGYVFGRSKDKKEGRY